MSECHNCPHYLDPSLKGLPWEKTPCSRCELTGEPNHKGKTYVSRDSSDAVVAEESTQGAQRDELTDVRVKKLAQFISNFMSLPAITRDIVAFKFTTPDKPLTEMARRYKITPQAAHSRLKKALYRFPVLREVIEMKERSK